MPDPQINLPDVDQVAIPLVALRELQEIDGTMTLSNALARITWALRHGAFTAVPSITLRPAPNAARDAIMAELDSVIARNEAAAPVCDDAPISYGGQITLADHPDPAPVPPDAKVPRPGGAAVTAAELMGDDLSPDRTEEAQDARIVAVHVALLRPDQTFDAAADEYLVRATLDGVAPNLICDQLGCDLAELKRRWSVLQVPGITMIDGKRSADGCQLLLEMLARKTELLAA